MIKIFLFTLLVSILFINANCDKDIVDPPPVPTDTIITVEKELADGEQPAVSPDGSKIAFVRKGDIWMMDTSGTNQKQLTNSADIDIIPRWKPDGLSIGFIRTTTGEYNKGRIFTVLPAGGGEIQIVQNYFAADSFVTASSGINYPIWDWSPDGEYIALLEQQGYKTLLKIVDVNSNGLFLTETLFDFASAKLKANNSCFVWSMNKNEIAFITQTLSGWRQVELKNFISNEIYIDSNYQDASSLTRKPNMNKYIFLKTFGTIILKDFKDNIDLAYEIYAGGGLKWSPDEKNLLFEYQGIVSGPFGYRYSSLSLFNFEKKQYTLTHQGDINITNYFFEWSKKNNEIIFERFKKSIKLRFNLQAEKELHDENN